MLRLAVAVLLILALPARANLGDVVADCIKRYGRPQTFTEASPNSPFGTLVFVAGPYGLIVFLHADVEVGARVSKKDKSAFTPAEMKTIMDADALTPWVPKPSTDPNTQQWTRADNATATYDIAAKMLLFTTPEMVKELRAPPPSAATNAAPQRPQGNFAPATPTPWAPPQPPSTNAAPATNAP